MAFQRKYESITCPPEQVVDQVMVWDAKGYQVEAMAATSSGTGNGHGPIVVILFRLRDRK